MEKHWIKVEGLFSVKDDGTIQYDSGFTPEKAKAEFERLHREVFSRSVPNLNKPIPFDTRGPAIEGHTIAVIHSIREEEQ